MSCLNNNYLAVPTQHTSIQVVTVEVHLLQCSILMNSRLSLLPLIPTQVKIALLRTVHIVKILD